MVRKTVRCHSEWKETKGCRLFIRSRRRGAFPELRVKLFQCIVKRICIYGADPFLRGKCMKGYFFYFPLIACFPFFSQSMRSGEKEERMQRVMSTQQMGVENRMVISLPERVRLLRRPLSPIGPKIRARTTAAVFNPSFLIR